jgi:tetrapyrrole methylase family protein / MazG family protein
MVQEDELAKYRDLRAIVAKLRAPDGCPWDREQTHASLRPYVVEEAYEVLATLDDNDLSGLEVELGDLLFQVLLHAQLAEEAGEFSMIGVLSALADKLVRRHPHVFGDVNLETAADVSAQWDRLKQAEREVEKKPALSGVPKALPALSLAQTLLRRAATAGFAWPDRRDVTEKVTEELEELAAAESRAEKTEEFGDLLLNFANYAEYLGIDAEEALRLASNKFRRRFEAVEREAGDASRPMTDMSRAELLALWERAKALE